MGARWLTNEKRLGRNVPELAHAASRDVLLTKTGFSVVIVASQ